jgi:hypothetical protein
MVVSLMCSCFCYTISLINVPPVPQPTNLCGGRVHIR